MELVIGALTVQGRGVFKQPLASRISVILLVYRWIALILGYAVLRVWNDQL